MVQVKLNSGQACEIEWEDMTRTVGDFLKAVQEKIEGVSLAGCKMVHRGQVMDESSPLEKYSVNPHSVIFVVVKNQQQQKPVPTTGPAEEDSDKQEGEGNERQQRMGSLPGTGASPSAAPSGGMPAFPGLGAGSPDLSGMIQGILNNPGALQSILGTNPMYSQIFQSPAFQQLISNPHYINFIMRMLQDPVLGPMALTNDPSRIMQPDNLARIQQLINEEMPELYSTIQNSMLNGEMGNFGFQGTNPFANYMQAAAEAAQRGGMNAHSAGGVQQEQGSSSHGGSVHNVAAEARDEESDDALDDIYSSSAADDKPFNSLGQREAITEFINRMLSSRVNETITQQPQTSVPINPTQQQQQSSTTVRNEPTMEELREKYNSQLESLHAMGFFDDDRALNLLHLTGGDVNATVDRLLGQM